MISVCQCNHQLVQHPQDPPKGSIFFFFFFPLWPPGPPPALPIIDPATAEAEADGRPGPAYRRRRIVLAHLRSRVHRCLPVMGLSWDSTSSKQEALPDGHKLSRGRRRRRPLPRRVFEGSRVEQPSRKRAALGRPQLLCDRFTAGEAGRRKRARRTRALCAMPGQGLCDSQLPSRRGTALEYAHVFRLKRNLCKSSWSTLFHDYHRRNDQQVQHGGCDPACRGGGLR